MATTPTPASPETEDFKKKFEDAELRAKAAETQLAEATAKLASTSELLKTTTDRLAVIEAEKTKAARLEAVMVSLKLSRDEAGLATAEKFVTPLATLSEDAFKAVLAAQAEIAKAAAPAKAAAAKLEEIVPAKAATAALDAVKTEPTPPLAAGAGNSDDPFKRACEQVAARYQPKKKGK